MVSTVKKKITTIAVAALMAIVAMAFTLPNVNGIANAKTKYFWDNAGKMKITHYCPKCNGDGIGNIGYGCASPKIDKLYNGCVAVPKSMLESAPFGSKIKINGKQYVIADISNGNVIDIFRDTPKKCECATLKPYTANVSVYKKVTGARVIAYGKKFMKKPNKIKYTFGGNPESLRTDASGFVCKVYKHYGIKLGRDSNAQKKNGKLVGKGSKALKKAKKGDLILFSHGGKAHTTYHVAIYAGKKSGKHTMLHCTVKGVKCAKIKAKEKKDIFSIRRVL